MIDADDSGEAGAMHLDHEAMKTDPFLQRVFGDNLPMLLVALRVCEASHLDHDDDEDGPYRGVVNLSVDILARMLGCHRDEVVSRADRCERALQDA